MKSSMFLVAAAFLCLVIFPTITLGKDLRFWPNPIKGWPHPSNTYRNLMLTSTSHKFNYGDSKVWKCTHSNGSAPAISISISPSQNTNNCTFAFNTQNVFAATYTISSSNSQNIFTPTNTVSCGSNSNEVSISTAANTQNVFAATYTISSSSSQNISTAAYTSSSPSEPSNPPPEHHHHQSPLEHFGSCVRNMGPVGECRGQMAFSFYTRMFQVSDYCCNLVVNMKNECEDAIWGYFTDPYFVSLVRFTCHIMY
ncbi:BnaC07g31820D [Brassica napus]|uniref:BnaC07g31820D protein n=1 Tax=Brassica napus TaxID=3708 RepID=A0A078G9B1_BRANA|nr:BnaC07g31820D [Brassica napus]